jgi:hydroxyethylthiazole kinase
VGLKVANKKKIPVVLDPVGAGATAYRTYATETLLRKGTVSVTRGNCNEICSLSGQNISSKGVDSSLTSADHIENAQTLAQLQSCVVMMSGKIDVITDGHESYKVHNGHPLMTKVTGMGCALTALTAAFLAVNQDSLAGSVHAAIFVGIVGEIAAKTAPGPGSFKQTFIDVLHNISASSIEKYMCVEEI